jgi:hypothetical protein
MAYTPTVAITSPSVRDGLYPVGCHGVLGLGIDAGSGSPEDSTFLTTYLPWVFGILLMTFLLR